MRLRTLAALVVLVVAVLASARNASADAKADIGTKIKAAMKAYDAFEYDSARKLLGQAIAIAKKAKLDKDPILANVYLDLGIVMFAVPDVEATKASFRSAVQIDPNVELELAYKSPELAKLLDSALAQVSRELRPSPGSGTPPPTSCASVRGVEHAIIHIANIGSAVPVEVRVGADAGASRVSLMYRGEGEAGYTELPLDKRGECSYLGSLPAAALESGVVYYYVAAFANGIVIATRGSADVPNTISIGGVPPKRAAVAASAPPDVAPKPAGPPRTRKFQIALAAGTGLAYIRGTTESQNAIKRCCFGSSLAVVTPELSYRLNPQLSIGGAFRFGRAVGANIEGNSRTALAGLARLRYALSPDGQGFHVMAQAGFGVLRNAVKVENADPGSDTDVLAQGPLLIGGGAGARRKISKNASLFADISVLAAIAATHHLGNTPLNSGIAADLTIGVAMML